MKGLNCACSKYWSWSSKKVFTLNFSLLQQNVTLAYSSTLKLARVFREVQSFHVWLKNFYASIEFGNTGNVVKGCSNE